MRLKTLKKKEIKEKKVAAMNVVVRWLVKATTTTGDGGGSARD